MKKNNNRTNTVRNSHAIIKRGYKFISTVFMLATLLVVSAYAEDPLATINNLSDFVFSAIRAIGIILLGWGIVQIGMSIQSHDASQRTNGFLCFFGGLLIAMAKTILDLILA